MMKSLETAGSKEPIRNTRLQGLAGCSRVNTMSLREKKENTTFIVLQTNVEMRTVYVCFTHRGVRFAMGIT